MSRSSKIAALITASPWEWGPTGSRLFGSLIFDICSPVCFGVAPVCAALRGGLADRDPWLQPLRGSEVQTAISIRARYAALATSWRSLLPSGSQALRRILLRRTNCSCNCMLRATRRTAMAGWVAVKQAAHNTVPGPRLLFHMGNYLLGSRELCSCGTDPASSFGPGNGAWPPGYPSAADKAAGCRPR